MKHVYWRHYGRFVPLLLATLLAGAFSARAQTTAPETFETGSKPDYPGASVTLGEGSWTLEDALLGSSALDRKNGTQSVRLQNLGRLTMDYFLPAGASLVTVQHALYGTDGTSGFELWYQSQACNCAKWIKAGATVISSRATLQTATFAVNVPGAVRFELRKVSGNGARLNLDDFAVAAYTTSVTAAPDNDHLALGNPSGALPEESQPTNYLMRKPQYALSYHRDRGIPNWVSWHLDQSDRGSAPRVDLFAPDPSLPAGWYQVQASGYQGAITGFDRGHNCPSADRTSSPENNAATFLMTNMIPQVSANNQETWANLEDYTRTFLPDNEVYVIMGSYGLGGTSATGYYETLDQGRIAVPKRIWKVVVVLPVGDNDVARVNASTRIIAIDTPNDVTVSPNWGQYRTSVNAIEAATGLNLLSALPVAVQEAIEATIDNGPTQ